MVCAIAGIHRPCSLNGTVSKEDNCKAIFAVMFEVTGGCGFRMGLCTHLLTQTSLQIISVSWIIGAPNLTISSKTCHFTPHQKYCF